MKYLDADEILLLFEAKEWVGRCEGTYGDGDDEIVYRQPSWQVHWVLFKYLEDHAPVKELVKALQRSSTSKHRIYALHVLHQLRPKGIGPALIPYLTDPDDTVRQLAADILGHTSYTASGVFIEQLLREANPTDSMRSLWTAILGSLGYKPAIPYLIELVSDESSNVRGAAAWALGKLQAYEALPTIQQALDREVERYPIQRMTETLHDLRSSSPIN